jgi:hypothetical protein
MYICVFDIEHGRCIQRILCMSYDLRINILCSPIQMRRLDHLSVPWSEYSSTSSHSLELHIYFEGRHLKLLVAFPHRIQSKTPYFARSHPSSFLHFSHRFPQSKHPHRIVPRSGSDNTNIHALDPGNSPRNPTNRTRLIPPLDHGPLDPLLLLEGLGQRGSAGEVPGAGVGGPHLAPRPVRLDLQALERDLAHDGAVLGRLHAAAVDADVEAEGDEGAHLGRRAGEGVDEAAPRERGEPAREDALKVGGGGARVQEQGQADLHGDVELRFKVLELHVFGAEEEPVVVEPDFPERDGVACGFGGEGEGGEGGEVGVWSVAVFMYFLCRARVHADGCVDGPGYALMLVV